MRALIFDLDGTLVDTVYAHVLAFQVAFSEAGVPIEAWRIHRHVGMSGDLLTQAVTRDSGIKVAKQKLEKIEKRHSQLLRKLLSKPEPLPGAVQLLKTLKKTKIRHGIATSGKPEEMKIALQGLGINQDDTVIVNRADAPRAKPEPDLFLACQMQLGVPANECYAVGDAIWDILAARKAGMLAIAFRTGGYSSEELAAAGAYRVFTNPEDLHGHLGELGLQPG